MCLTVVTDQMDHYGYEFFVFVVFLTITQNRIQVSLNTNTGLSVWDQCKK